MRVVMLETAKSEASLAMAGASASSGRRRRSRSVRISSIGSAMVMAVPSVERLISPRPRPAAKNEKRGARRFGLPAHISVRRAAMIAARFGISVSRLFGRFGHPGRREHGYVGAVPTLGEELHLAGGLGE